MASSKLSYQIFGKGGKERTAYFNEYCKKQLLNYIKERNKNIKKVPINDYLFLNSRKQKFKRNGIYYICKKAYKLIKIDDKHYSTHTLRHTSATLLYMYVKEDMLLLKEFLGHSSITSTEIYTHIKNNKIKEAVDKNPLNEFILEEYKKSA